MSEKQFNIQFHAGNPLAERFKSGTFTCLLEIDSPRGDQPFASAVGIAKTLARCSENHDYVQAVAVTDRLRSENSHDPVEVAQALQRETSKPILLHVSGKGSDENRIRGVLGHAHSNGVHSLLAVTGDRSDLHPHSRTTGRMPPHPIGYHDSVKTIREARATGYPLFIGCGVNPFKYNPADQYLQYYKLMRKLSAGADFILVQAGWDMRKHQEIKWFLQMREMEVPIVARLMLLSREKIERIHDGFLPGTPVSRSFAAQLQRESDISDAQCLSTQLRRLSLQVAGCRLLGFSGVQIAGIDNEQTFNMVVKAIETAPNAIATYPDWVAAWRDFHANIEFTPASSAYYMFENLLDMENPVYIPETCRLTEQHFPKSVFTDRFRHRVQSVVQSSDVLVAMARRLQRRHAQTDAPLEHDENVHAMNLKPKTCPKRLVFGACGGSEPNGLCEFGHDTCFFHRVLALANDLKMLNRLEEINPL